MALKLHTCAFKYYTLVLTASDSLPQYTTTKINSDDKHSDSGHLWSPSEMVLSQVVKHSKTFYTKWLFFSLLSWRMHLKSFIPNIMQHKSTRRDKGSVGVRLQAKGQVIKLKRVSLGKYKEARLYYLYLSLYRIQFKTFRESHELSITDCSSFSSPLAAVILFKPQFWFFTPDLIWYELHGSCHLDFTYSMM